MKLDTDQIDIEATPDGIRVQPSYVSFLQSHGYNIDSVNDVRVVPSSSRDIGHVIMKLETTDKPAGHPESDIIEDQCEVICCSCEDWQYNQSIDVSEKTIAEGTFGTCKHQREAFKTERAKADDSQETL